MTPDSIEKIVEKSAEVNEHVQRVIYQQVEQATETVGQVVSPIAEHPIVQTAANIPGLNYFLKWIGTVDIQAATADVERLQLKHPTEAPDAIAQRIINESALKAGQIGLLTNIVPPIALALFAVDLAAITKLQADMLYRIAAVYGFDLEDSARRGELVSVYVLSLGSSTPIKAALGLVEAIPIFGAAVGASSNCALLYLVGVAAQQFYVTKQVQQIS